MACSPLRFDDRVLFIFITDAQDLHYLIFKSLPACYWRRNKYDGKKRGDVKTDPRCMRGGLEQDGQRCQDHSDNHIVADINCDRVWLHRLPSKGEEFGYQALPSRFIYILPTTCSRVFSVNYRYHLSQPLFQSSVFYALQRQRAHGGSSHSLNTVAVCQCRYHSRLVGPPVDHGRTGP